MTNKELRSIKVAAVQMMSQDGKVSENLNRAEAFVAKASEVGAKLIVLPEFMPQGYRLTQEIWETAESMEGPTVEWLKRNLSIRKLAE